MNLKTFKKIIELNLMKYKMNFKKKNYPYKNKFQCNKILSNY